MQSKEQNNGLTINFSINVNGESLKNLTTVIASQAVNLIKNVIMDKQVSELLRSILPSVTVTSSISSPETKEEDKTCAKEDAPATVNEEPVPSFDPEEVAKRIVSSMELLKDGFDLDEVNQDMTEAVRAMTDGLVDCYLVVTPKRGIYAKFINTPALRAIHGPRWNGHIKTENIAAELARAFFKKVEEAPAVPVPVTEQPSEEEVPVDSTTPCVSSRKFSRRKRGYAQGTYGRVKRGSMTIRMRRNKNGEGFAPMVIDPDFAQRMTEKKLTHVQIMRGQDSDAPYMFFTREDVPTRAPRNSAVYSRLHIYGINSNSGTPTTYSINGSAFQESILKKFGLDASAIKEAMFEIRVMKEKDDSCMVRIIK